MGAPAQLSRGSLRHPTAQRQLELPGSRLRGRTSRQRGPLHVQPGGAVNNPTLSREEQYKTEQQTWRYV